MANPGPLSKEGTIPFAFGDDTYQTWYKIYGELGSRRPLVVVHGGPGISHDYLVPHSDLNVNASIPIILYDQIGNARST